MNILRYQCFVVRPGQRGHRLNAETVPSIFKFPEYLQMPEAK